MSIHQYTVKAEGPLTAEFAVVAEKPSWTEVNRKRPLIGSAGSYLRDHVKVAGLKPGTKYWNERFKEFSFLDDSEIYLTNAVESFDDPGSNPNIEQLWEQQPRLIQELSSMPNLKCILAMGNWGLASLGNFAYSKFDKKAPLPTGIMKWRGSVVPSIIPSNVIKNEQVKMVPCLHTSFYQHGEWRFKDIVQFDISRAVKQSKFPERRFIERFFNVRPDGLQEVLRWLDELELDLDRGKYDHTLKDGRKVRGVGWDIEAVKGRFNKRYISCIAFCYNPLEAFCIPIQYNNRAPYFSIYEECVIWKRLQRLFNRKDVTFISQNGSSFDNPVIRQHGLVIPDSVMANGFDTMHAHSLLAADLPHDLGFLTSIYTDFEYYKDESGDWDNLIKTPEQQFWVYNNKDAMSQLICGYGIMDDLLDYPEAVAA